MRKSLTISGSGYDQYLYSPRPNPCLAMTIVFRKLSSRSYIEARDRHSSGVSTAFKVVTPYLSRSAAIASQSRAATRFGIEGVLVFTPPFFALIENFEVVVMTEPYHRSRER